MQIEQPYQPQPLDVGGVALDPSLDALVEALAKNVHDTWAKGRMGQGWTWGPERDDVGKKHPCLVPYENLPESERDYDRNTAMATIKMILKSGYVIEKEKGWRIDVRVIP